MGAMCLGLKRKDASQTLDLASNLVDTLRAHFGSAPLGFAQFPNRTTPPCATAYE